jgi:hypothetical protein
MAKKKQIVPGATTIIARMKKKPERALPLKELTMTQHILIMGNPVDGFQFIGPFDIIDDAIKYGNTDGNIGDHEWWTAEILVPEYTEIEESK